MALDDFEILLHDKFLNLQTLEWEAPVLTADFGSGWGAGINVGNSAGLHYFALSAALIPDRDQYSIDYIETTAKNDPRFTYFFEFYKRHVTTNNKPFYLTDCHSTDPKTFLVSFMPGQNEKISFEVLAQQLYRGGGIILGQRRATGIDFNSADGDVDLSDMVPANFTANAADTQSVQLDWDANGEADGYEVNIVRTNEIIDVGTAETYTENGLTSGTFYYYRVRSYKDNGLKGVWSSQQGDAPLGA